MIYMFLSNNLSSGDINSSNLPCCTLDFGGKKRREVWLLSGRVLDLRSRGRRFEPHRRHCVVSLSKTFCPLFCTGSTQEDLSRHD